MTYVSPLLNNTIKNSKASTTNTNSTNAISTNYHEQIYRDLRKRANEVKPNKAKAKLVKEGMLGNPITAIKDTCKDAKNFATTIATGHASDSSLGNINDLGLKAGALLIATFLASQAKTKTSAIMQFVGGGTFLASMALWPKLFINIPARLVHGFRIDRKYISAQGDKKDFGLDNQFLVWDAYPEEQLRKDAKNAGINYDGKDGKEKIQRKIQKTMLQNRTLWMATAGFATPLMTALIGSAVEPKVKNAVINSEFKKAQQKLQNGMGNLLSSDNIKIQSNKAEIEALFKNYEGKALDDEYFNKLAQLLTPTDFLSQYRSEDDIAPLKETTTQDLAQTLKQLNVQQSGINVEKFKQTLKEIEIINNESIFDDVATTTRRLSQEEIDNIIEQINSETSKKRIGEILEESNIPTGKVDEIIKNLKTDNKTFEQTIRNYNENIVSAFRGKLKTYTDFANATLGSKAESVYTEEFDKELNNIFKNLFGTPDIEKLKNLSKNNEEVIQTTLSDAIKSNLKDVKFGSEEYFEVLNKFQPLQLPQSIEDFVNTLADDANINAIRLSESDLDKFFADNKIENSKIKETIKNLNNSILGADKHSKGILALLKTFIRDKRLDLDVVKSKLLLCTNFEARLQNGDLDLSKAQIELARKMLYSGTVSDRANKLYASNPQDYMDMVKKVLNPECFNAEEGVKPGIKNLVQSLLDIDLLIDNERKKIPVLTSKQYLENSSFTDLIRNHATGLYNNKSWKKIFVPMAIALGAVTLLVQPFFGNIKKEFPDENKIGGAR